MTEHKREEIAKIAGNQKVDEMERKPRVLFICTHNSARSQMAVGLGAVWRLVRGRECRNRSAGGEPAGGGHDGGDRN